MPKSRSCRSRKEDSYAVHHCGDFCKDMAGASLDPWIKLPDCAYGSRGIFVQSWLGGGLEVSILLHLSEINMHLFIFTFVFPGDPGQGLLHTRQVLYH